MLSIDEALAKIDQQSKAPLPAPEEKPSEGSMTQWLVALAAIIGITTLGVWLTRRARKSGAS
jgi:hypothetical protein